MKIKFLMSTILAMIFSAFAIAQENTGVKLLRLGEADLAKQYFDQHLSENPGAFNYYLGEIEWYNGDKNAAKPYYERCIAVDPNSIDGQLAAAKLLLLSNPKEGQKELEKIAKKNKKNVDAILEVARTFYWENLDEEADKLIEMAQKANMKDPNIYILNGDVAQKKNEIGDAVQQYDQALLFDNENVVALIKSGIVYEKTASNQAKATAIANYKKALDVNPDDKLVMRFLARVYNRTGHYPASIMLYKKYFETEAINDEDLVYYGRSLFFNNNFNEAKELLLKGLKNNPDDFVMNRLLMYTDKELNQVDEGLQVADKFFKLRTGADAGYIDRDYLTYADLLLKAGKKEEAYLAFDKAAELNPENKSVLKDMAADLYKDKLYAEAADVLSRYINGLGDEVLYEDYDALGRYYQSAGQTMKADSVMTEEELAAAKKDFYVKADEVFQKMIEMEPELFRGHFLKAGVNSLIDSDMKQGLAKPHYEKVIEILNTNGEAAQRSNIMIPAYEYLAFYYYVQSTLSKDPENRKKCVEYCDLVLQLDPTRENPAKLKAAFEKK